MALITAPRRFGESTNLDILQRFCEISVDMYGKQSDKKKCENFQIYSKMYSYNKTGQLEYLNVYKVVNYSLLVFFNETFGEFPIIYLDFKVLSGKYFDSFLEDFINLIDEEYSRHQYLLNSNNIKLTPYKFRKLNRYYKQMVDKSLSESDLKIIIKFLSNTSMLFIHYNKRVIVLVDEFD